jgi:hypothetical protein
VKFLWVYFRALAPTREQAAEQFSSYIQFYCSGQRFSTPIRHALFSLLTQADPTKDVSEQRMSE